MRNHRRALFAAFAALLAASFQTIAAQPQKQKEEPKAQDLIKEVRHQLVLLPYYSVFDNLAFKVEGSKVTLLGQVVRPTLKTDADFSKMSGGGIKSVFLKPFDALFKKKPKGAEIPVKMTGTYQHPEPGLELSGGKK